MAVTPKPTPKPILATSTLSTASFPDLDLVLLAGVPTPIPASAVSRVISHPGVIVTEAPSTDTPAEEQK